MRIKLQGFMGQNHSWAIVHWGLARGLKNLGHKIDLFATDGIEYLPPDLKENLIGYIELNKPEKLHGKLPDKEYDCQISYTAMKNWPLYLSNGYQNRFGIWCWEWAGKNSLPTGFAKHYKSCDNILAPSTFAKRVFIESGIPENIITVLSHGIDEKKYRQTTTISLPTNKKFKLLANIQQPHLRKNIPGLLKVYGQAFDKNDDVCLILKVKNKEVKTPFEVSLNQCLQDFNKSFPEHAEVKLYNEFLEDISILYRSVDAVFSMTFAEGFFLPALESICSSKLVIAPKWGGQIDFLNEDNSLLIDGRETRADPKSMYWESKNNSIWFTPDINDAVKKLQYAYHNFESFNKTLSLQKENLIVKYSWKTISKQIENMCK